MNVFLSDSPVSPLVDDLVYQMDACELVKGNPYRMCQLIFFHIYLIILFHVHVWTLKNQLSWFNTVVHVSSLNKKKDYAK